MNLRSLATGSSAARWLKCPASVSMSVGIEREETEWSLEGTEAHEKGRDAINNNIEETAIKDEAVRIYVEHARTFSFGCPIFTEKRLPLLDSSGMLDGYSVSNKMGNIFDFKYGVGVRLHAEKNEQLAFYACALKENYPELTTITVHLIQPRVDGIFEDTPSISSWTLTWQTLKKWRKIFEEGLNEVEIAKKIQAGSHCQFCPARGRCEVHLNYAEAIVRAQDNEPIDNLPITLEDHTPSTDTIERLAKIVKMEKRIKGYFDKARSYLFSCAKNGIEVPGFELGPKRTHRIWHPIMTEEEIAAELRAKGIEDPYEHKLMSFTKAEKKVDISDLVIKPEGELTLKEIIE